jgi:hypothetical protein
MTKYRYLRQYLDLNDPNHIKRLNDLGQEGWKLTYCEYITTSYMCIFIKKIEE